MNTGDKVRIIDGYYKGQEGHIEGFKDGQIIVALQNEYGCVNTLMLANRLEYLNEKVYIIDLVNMIHDELVDIGEADTKFAKRLGVVKILLALGKIRECIRSLD